jgi:predicted transcriptional regulator YdeE
MNRAVDYLEANITEKLDIEKVAKIALSSPFHFQRMYHMITGVTIAEYMRRRRLTLAAQDILSGRKIINVAYRYGYETPEAFTKAFRKMHGISPSAARELGANLKDEFNYIIGVEEIKETLPKGYVSATIPAATWAVFESVGALPEALMDIIRRVYSEWFPATGYQHDLCTPGLEVYPEGDKHSPDYRCEYWVPVKK